MIVGEDELGADKVLDKPCVRAKFEQAKVAEGLHDEDVST